MEELKRLLGLILAFGWNACLRGPPGIVPLNYQKTRKGGYLKRFVCSPQSAIGSLQLAVYGFKSAAVGELRH